MINKELWETIVSIHKKTIGIDLFSFLFDDISLIEVSPSSICIGLDQFSIKFFSKSSVNYNLFFSTCSKVLYSEQFNLSFVNKDNYQQNVISSNEVNSQTETINISSLIEKADSIADLPKKFKSIPTTEENLLIENIIAKEGYTSTNEHELDINTNLNESIEINSFNYSSSNLKSNLTFKNFFYSYENKQVINGAKLIISEIDNPSMNPFFIHGNSGIGKTHLLNAIGNEIHSLHPTKRILYMEANAFLEEYTSLFKGGINNTNKIDDFKDKYNNLDLLLIDDIQSLESKEASLNEFFDIFEKMRNNNKMIVIASDTHPNNLRFEPRLITRFLSGLNCEVQFPDTDTKKQIFSYYALERDINITEDAIEVFINKSTNVRVLLGYLNVITLSFIDNDNLTNVVNKDDAIKILNNTNSTKSKITEEDIIEIITQHFKITKKDLTSKKRDSNIVTSRHFIAFFLRKKLKYKHTKIAYTLGFKDHTAALNAIKQANKKSKNNKYINDFNIISQQVNN